VVARHTEDGADGPQVNTGSILAAQPAGGVLLAGLQGAGKTTTRLKIGAFSKRGKKEKSVWWSAAWRVPSRRHPSTAHAGRSETVLCTRPRGGQTEKPGRQSGEKGGARSTRRRKNHADVLLVVHRRAAGSRRRK